jgi:hypothetical protein
LRATQCGRGGDIVKEVAALRIDGYRFGEIIIGGKRYHRDLMVKGEAVLDSWWREEGHTVRMEDLLPLLDDPPDMLVVGQGDPGLMEVPEEVRDALRAKGIAVSVAPTRDAVTQFNAAADRCKVAGAFHLTC